MSVSGENKPLGTSSRRPGPFGPAWALLPKGQEVLSVDESTPAYDALDRMMDTGYSQLPVTSEGRIHWRLHVEVIQ